MCENTHDRLLDLVFSNESRLVREWTWFIYRGAVFVAVLYERHNKPFVIVIMLMKLPVLCGIDVQHLRFALPVEAYNPRAALTRQHLHCVHGHVQRTNYTEVTVEQILYVKI